MDELLEAVRSLRLDPEAAVAERVAPLLYFSDRSGASVLLRKAYYESAARNVVLLDALDELMEAFASRGVRPVVLKGADFARRLYSSAALRPMGDLDLWVSPEEVATAESVLVSLGYRPGVPEMAPGLTRRIRHARLYVGGAREDVPVDLHWSLVGHDTDRRAPSLEWFRDRSKDSKLDATAGLLYVAAHLKLQHYDERPPLIWLSDFYLLSKRPEVEWEALFDAARRFRWEAALAATADEVALRLGVELPGELASCARRVEMSFPERKGGPERAWNELTTLSVRGRAALLRAYLFPSPSYLRYRYRPRPSWAWPLCYPLRWARLLASALSLAVKERSTRPLLGSPRSSISAAGPHPHRSELRAPLGSLLLASAWFRRSASREGERSARILGEAP